jgi:hypothetical protein
MATTEDSVGSTTEQCDECNRDTAHEVRVELITESQKEENAHYSREPYRVSECQYCGNRETRRMNNA